MSGFLKKLRQKGVVLSSWKNWATCLRTIILHVGQRFLLRQGSGLHAFWANLKLRKNSLNPSYGHQNKGPSSPCPWCNWTTSVFWVSITPLPNSHPTPIWLTASIPALQNFLFCLVAFPFISRYLIVLPSGIFIPSTLSHSYVILSQPLFILSPALGGWDFALTFLIFLSPG